MSLFFDVLSSINDPNQQGSVDQLNSVFSSLQQLSSRQGLDTDQMSSVLNALGGALQPVLKQQVSGLGTDQLIGMLGQLTGGGGLANLQSVLPPQLQEQLIQSVAQKSGLNVGMVQSMLPQLMPLVMGLFNMGAAKSGGGNALVKAFLNASGTSGTDLGTVMKFADRFLNPPA